MSALGHVRQSSFKIVWLLCSIANLFWKKTPQKHSATFDTLTLSASSNDHDAKFSFSHPLDIIVNFSILLTLWPLGTHMKWYLTWEQLWEMYDGNLTIISFDGSKSWIINDGFHFPLIEIGANDRNRGQF